MNYSVLKEAVYRYLSYREICPSQEIDERICHFSETLDRLDSFRYLVAEYDRPLDFLRTEPYTSFLFGTNGYYLFACTLGVKVDRMLHKLALSEPADMILLDACANAYLEHRTNEVKNALAPEVSYLFCPGYQGSPLSDVKYIFNQLHPERIGVELTDTYMMIPQKSLVGIIGKGASPEKKCGDCAKQNNCVYRKVGKLCFQSEKN